MIAIAVTAGDRLAAAGDGKPGNRLNSWESHASISSTNKTAERIEKLVGLLDQLLWDIIKEVLINAVLIFVRLCDCWVHISWVDSLANHAVDIVDHFGLNLWWGRSRIRVEMMKCICDFINNCVINVFCSVLTLCSTSWTQLWRDHIPACFPGEETMLDLHYGAGNECRVDLINWWSIFHSHMSYTIEVCPVNMILNCSCYKLKLVLLNWLSRKWLHNKWTLNLPHERLCGMWTEPWLRSRLLCPRSL